MSNILENRKMQSAYENIVVNEAKKGNRRKLQLLDDKIDEFMDYLESKASNIDDNPVFQRKVFQMIADATKEHAEFVAAMKRVAATLDSGAQVIPKTTTSMKFKRNVDPYDSGEEQPAPNEVPPANTPPGQEASNEETLIESKALDRNIKQLYNATNKLHTSLEDQVSSLQGADLAKGASLLTDAHQSLVSYLASLTKLSKLIP